MNTTPDSYFADPETAARLKGMAAAPARFGQRAGLDAGLADWAAREADAWTAEIEAGGATVAPRLASLRAELARRGLHGFVVPMTDEYFGEYLPQNAQRLAWLTGFTGSAGMAIVLAERAAVWSDGRYTLQLRDQVDATLFELLHITDEPPTAWLAQQAKPGQRIGYDPRLHTQDGVARLAAAARKARAELVPVESNPVDTVWTARPPAPIAPVAVQPDSLTGESAAQKRERIAKTLRDEGRDAVVLTLPESVVWLLNIRGGDVPHTPLVHATAILRADATLDLFVDGRKLDDAARAHLGNAVTVRPTAEFGAALEALAGQRVQVDPTAASAWVFDRLGKAEVAKADDPCLLPKACKNEVELAGIRAAHVRDGAALTRFLFWLSQQKPGTVDELQAGAKLEEFRRADPRIRDLSFASITGSGPNGAIVHYRATAKSNRVLGGGELFLIDSGAQYLDGTTDVTRTIAIGAPEAEMRDRFTRVLQGHIALARAVFPAGTTGSQLDALARVPLWQAGLDYDHGTGHGVGAYLSVHEGPHRISKMANSVALRPGMIVSNEPGYYRTGAYGIRIENLVAVQDVPTPPGGERKVMGFETLTLAPIDLNLVEPALLSNPEIAWLNAYHARVRQTLTPLLDEPTAAWLADATRPL